MEEQELKRVVEALIFAADAPLTGERIQETLPDELNGFDLNRIIDDLNRDYDESGRAFFIRQVAGGYQVSTRPELHNWIKKLFLGRNKMRLSHAALETLAIIAFKQPISRVDVAQIRGVNSDGVIGTLLEKKLVTISGRSEGVGRPLLYNTTPEFLQYFGVNDLSDLPKPREIEELIGKEGMPEEVLHALSDEKQLELPISLNTEGQPEVEESAISVNESAPLKEDSEEAMAATIPKDVAPAGQDLEQIDISSEHDGLAAPVAVDEVEESPEEELDAIVVEDPDAADGEIADGESDASENGEEVKSTAPAMGISAEEVLAGHATQEHLQENDAPERRAAFEPEPAPSPETVAPESAEDFFLPEFPVEPRHAVQPTIVDLEDVTNTLSEVSVVQIADMDRSTPMPPEPISPAGGKDSTSLAHVAGDAREAEPAANTEPGARDLASEKEAASPVHAMHTERYWGAAAPRPEREIIRAEVQAPLDPPILERNAESETPFFVLAPSANGAQWTDDTGKAGGGVTAFLRRAVGWIKSAWQKLVGN